MTEEEKPTTDWKRVTSMTDDEIDYSDLPELDDNWFADAAYTPKKRRLTIRLDEDILLWFKQQGRGYQTRINNALRSYIVARKTPTR